MPRKAAKKTPVKTVTFELKAPDAKEVYLAGDFNQWDPGKTPLKANKKNGSWKGSLKLEPGRYHYKFVVDGHWWTDPANTNNEWNQYGTQNSILDVN